MDDVRSSCVTRSFGILGVIAIGALPMVLLAMVSLLLYLSALMSVLQVK